MIHGLRFLDANHLKSFSLKGKKESAIGRNPDPTQRSLEAYFQSKHSFLISEHGEKNYRTNEKLHSYFIYQLGKAKNKINQSDELVRTTYYQWHNHHFFSNVYLSSKYHKVLNKSHTVLFYIEKDIEIESILKICEAKTIGFIVPHEKEEGYRFAIRSKLSSGCTDEVSVLSFQSNNQQQIENAQNQLFGNLYLCDKDNNKSLMPPEKTSSSIFSIIKEDPIRRKSKSAFKLFSSLTNHHPTLHQKQQKHKSMSDIQEKLIHDLSVKTPNKPRSKSASVPDPPYHTPSIKSHYSHESKLTLKSLATTKETQSQLYRMGTESSAIHQQRCFSPSFHPSRTASYEIQSVSRKKLAEEFSPKLDYIFTPSQSGSSNETTPSMIEPESESSSSLNSRSSSAISTFSHPYQLDPQQNIKIPTIQPERSKSDLLIPIASPEDMSFQKRLPFDYDLASIVEDKNRTINALTERLRKREEKILMLKADWYDSLRELGTVCDKFNSELQDIASMYEHHQKEPPDRPSNPSPDTQIQKKFETALIERNHWMLQATILKFQLKDQQTQQSYTRSYHRRSY